MDQGTCSFSGGRPYIETPRTLGTMKSDTQIILLIGDTADGVSVKLKIDRSTLVSSPRCHDFSISWQDFLVLNE